MSGNNDIPDIPIIDSGTAGNVAGESPPKVGLTACVQSFGSTLTSGTETECTAFDALAAACTLSTTNIPGSMPAPAPMLVFLPTNVPAIPTFAHPTTPGFLCMPEGYPLVAMTPLIMGTIINFKHVKLEGEPKVDWSGLAAPSLGTLMCYHYAGDLNEQKNHALCLTLPDDFKFKKKCDLTNLMATLTCHVKTHGMDSILLCPRS